MDQTPSPTAAPVLIEVLATSVGAARSALEGGADRIELCENDPQGGTTPSVGTLERVVELAGPAGVRVHMMIRPRGGGFVYDADERAVMRRDAAEAVARGAHGIVVGALTPAGEVDVPLVAELVGLAGGRPVTFHRAVDVAADIDAGVQAAFAAGCARVLTSGGAPRARDGVAALARLVAAAPEGAVVLAGGGITAPDVPDLLSAGIRELHVSARGYRTDGASPSPPGMVGVTAGPSPHWPVNGWPAPRVEVLAGLRAAVRAAQA